MSKQTTPHEDQSPKPAKYETELQQLQQIETAVRTGEVTALTARWKSGQYLNKLKNGKQQLPPGLGATLCEALGVSRAELTARMKFARKYPSKADVTNAVRNFRSWHAIVRDGLTDTPQTKDDSVATGDDEEQVDDKGRSHAALQQVVDLLENIEQEFLGEDEEPLLTQIAALVTRLREGKRILTAAA